MIPATLPDEGQAEYVAPNVSAFQMLSILERSVSNVMVADRLTSAGLDPEAVGELTRRVDLRTMKLGAKGQETHDQGQGFMLSYVFMMIIYMTVLMYGIYVMRGVLEEKSSHIVEVIISTVKPFELMLGKILGIGAVGLTQFLLWSIMMVAISAPGAAAAVGMGGLELPAVPAIQIVFFVIYFVLGFLLYGTLYAGIGAAFDTEQEAQNFQGAITMFLVVPLVLMMYILNQPDAPLSVALSLFPFFTPMLMFLQDDPDPGAGDPARGVGGDHGRDHPGRDLDRGKDLPRRNPHARLEAQAQGHVAVDSGGVSVRVCGAMGGVRRHATLFAANRVGARHPSREILSVSSRRHTGG